MFDCVRRRIDPGKTCFSIDKSNNVGIFLSGVCSQILLCQGLEFFGGKCQEAKVFEKLDFSGFGKW